LQKRGCSEGASCHRRACCRAVGRSLPNFNQRRPLRGVEWELTPGRSPSLHLPGADRIQGIRNSTHDFGLPGCSVQKAAVATSFALGSYVLVKASCWFRRATLCSGARSAMAFWTIRHRPASRPASSGPGRGSRRLGTSSTFHVGIGFKSTRRPFFGQRTWDLSDRLNESKGLWVVKSRSPGKRCADLWMENVDQSSSPKLPICGK
jgi:hypothetical protein